MGIASVPNLRDLGGWAAADGRRVRRGVLYRASDLSPVQGDDLASLEALNLRTVFDLRTEAERQARPDARAAGASYVDLDILADAPGAKPAQLLDVVADPAAAAEELGHERAKAIFEDAYRAIVTLPSALRGYRSLFAQLAEEPRRPALFHCTTGKDRTGWAAAATLMLLGVDAVDVQRDYMLTNDLLLPALQPILDRFAAAGGDPQLLVPVLGVKAGYLDVAIATMKEGYGDIEGYFADGLGIDAAGQRTLRDALTEA